MPPGHSDPARPSQPPTSGGALRVAIEDLTPAQRDRLIVHVAQSLARADGAPHRGWARWEGHARAVVDGLMKVPS